MINDDNKKVERGVDGKFTARRNQTTIKQPSTNEHPGRWPVGMHDLTTPQCRVPEERLGCVTWGDVKATRDYILQLERERDEFRRLMVSACAESCENGKVIIELEQENAELRKRVEELSAELTPCMVANAELRRKLDRANRADADISEALNSGDGGYRP